MDRAGINQDDSTRRRDVTCALMQKRLSTTLDQADYKIIMAVTRIGMSNIMGVQISKSQLGIVPEFRPFLALHTLIFTINGFSGLAEYCPIEMRGRESA